MTDAFVDLGVQQRHSGTTEPHKDEEVLRYLFHECDFSVRGATETLETAFDYSPSRETVRRWKNKHGLRSSGDSAFADLLNGDTTDTTDTEHGQPPKFLLDRSDESPVHPVDTGCFNSVGEVWGEVDADQVAHAANNNRRDASQSQTNSTHPDSTDSLSNSVSGVLKGSIDNDSKPTQWRVAKTDRESGLVAPPHAVLDIPRKFRVCGCGDCEERHYLNGDGGAVDCPTPLPCTIGGARQIYQTTEGTAMSEDKHGNDKQQARKKYGKLCHADSASLRTNFVDGERIQVPPRSNLPNITTVLVSLRQSPTDAEGRLVTPWKLIRDTKDALDETRPQLPTDSDSDGFIAGYWLITGTDQWSTPHCHWYGWFFDPNDDIEEADFRGAVEEYVDAATHAADAHFTDSGELIEGPVRIEHEPLPVDPEVLHRQQDGPFADLLDPSETGPKRLIDGDDIQSRGAVYVGSQIPELALVGAETDADAETVAFLKAAYDGRPNCRGQGRFYELAESSYTNNVAD